MAQKNTVSDPYLENITAQIQEIDEQIKAANKKLFDRKAELETIKTHYIKFKKSMLESK
jgi:peptidoglycan hydrolase CwlO-like protein